MIRPSTPRLIALALAACAALPLRAAEPNPLLVNVINVLPDVPLDVQGDLLRRDGEGKVRTTYRVGMVLDWKADIPTARYTVRDAFGVTLQHLAITWQIPGEPEYRYFEGNPLQAAALPPLNSAILDTDITWLDLSLSFLWWQGGEPRGTEEVRGRPCLVADIPAPEDLVSDLDGVRLWIEKKIGIVLRAEGFDADGQLVRRMDVKSFKKIGKHWVIKDIEFQSFPAKTRTSLLVRDVDERKRFELPDRDTRAPDFSDTLPEPTLIEPEKINQPAPAL